MTGVIQVVVAMKPLEGNFAQNAVEHGVAGLNIDDGRVDTKGESVVINTWDNGAKPFGDGAGNPYTGRQETQGRWPANVILEESEDIVSEFPNSSGKGGNKAGSKDTREIVGGFGFKAVHIERRNDQGSAARFFKQVGEYDEECG